MSHAEVRSAQVAAQKRSAQRLAQLAQLAQLDQADRRGPGVAATLVRPAQRVRKAAPE